MPKTTQTTLTTATGLRAVEVERFEDYSVRIEGVAIEDKPLYITAEVAESLAKWLDRTRYRRTR